MRSTVLIVCFSVLLSQNMVRAQAANPNDSAELVRALLARVDQLEKRVAELEGRSIPPVPAPAATQPVPAPAVAQTAPTPATQPESARPDIHPRHIASLQGTAPSTHIPTLSAADFPATAHHRAPGPSTAAQSVLRPH